MRSLKRYNCRNAARLNARLFHPAWIFKAVFPFNFNLTFYLLYNPSASQVSLHSGLPHDPLVKQIPPEVSKHTLLKIQIPGKT